MCMHVCLWWFDYDVHDHGDQRMVIDALLLDLK